MKNKKHPEVKSTASYLYQKFLSIDKKTRKNMIIGGGMILILLVTGVLLGVIALVKFGGSLIDNQL